MAPTADASVITFSSKVRIEWNRDLFGSATTTDLVRGDTTLLPVGAGAESCLENSTLTSFHDDATPAVSGQVFWYLVRSANACGSDGYGFDSSGSERVTATCP